MSLPGSVTKAGATELPAAPVHDAAAASPPVVDSGAGGRRAATTGDRSAAVRVAAVLLSIFAAAALLRFVELASNPGGLYPDEAAEALDAQRLLHWQGLPPVWFASDGGREALFAYLVAAAFKLFGPSVLVLRATAAAVGVASVAAAWLVGRRFGQGVGLVAAAWMAGSLWLVAVSRDGMRNALVPLFGALALAALLWWAERPSRRRAAGAGALLAVASLYTYQPLKLLPLLAIVWFVWLRRNDRPLFEAMWHGAREAVAAFAIVAAPMALVAIAEPANYFGRIAFVTPFNPAIQPESDPLTHVVRTLGMLTFFGDPNPRHDVDAMPLLGVPVVAWPLFALACAGVARLWSRRRDAAHSLILIALPVFLVPPLVAVEGGSPHFLRALGLAAPLAIAIGLGAVELGERAARVGRRADTGADTHADTRGPAPSARDAGPRGAPPAPAAGRVARVAVAAVVVVVLAGQAVAAGSLYLSRPVADRYLAFSFDVVALAEAAGPNDAVITNDHLAYTVEFLDTGKAPAIYPDAGSVGDPRRFGAVVSLDRASLEAVAARWRWGSIRAVAWNPDGQPTVWALAP